jgi:hypothetical protein
MTLIGCAGIGVWASRPVFSSSTVRDIPNALKGRQPMAKGDFARLRQWAENDGYEIHVTQPGSTQDGTWRVSGT